MENIDTVKPVLVKLFNIQQSLKATKGNRNEFGGYNYRSCEDVLEALKPFLKENKCIVNLSDSVVLIGDRYYVCATASITDIELGTSHSVDAYAREELERKKSDASQITGATSSYARKYALSGLFAIDDNKDSDVTNKHGKDEVPSYPTKRDRLQVDKNDIDAQISNCKTIEELEDVKENLRGWISKKRDAGIKEELTAFIVKKLEEKVKKLGEAK